MSTRQHLQKINQLWETLCPKKFQELAPSTLFTSPLKYSSHRHRDYGHLHVYKNPVMETYTQVKRKDVVSSHKRRIPIPRERFESITRLLTIENTMYFNTILEILESMIETNDKIVCVKTMPLYLLDRVGTSMFVHETPPIFSATKYLIGGEKTIRPSGDFGRSNALGITARHGGHVVLVSKKGLIFTFEFYSSKQYESNCSSRPDMTHIPHALQLRCIYDLHYNNQSLSRSFINNVIEPYLDHMIYDTPDFIYENVNANMTFFHNQFRFNEDIVDTLIILVYSQLHNANQQCIQKQSSSKHQLQQKEQTRAHELDKREFQLNKLQTILQSKVKTLNERQLEIKKLQDQHRERTIDLKKKQQDMTSFMNQLLRDIGDSVQKYITIDQFRRDTRPLPHQSHFDTSGITTLYDLLIKVFPTHRRISSFKLYHGTENVSRRSIKSQGIRLQKNVISAHGRGFYVSPIPSVAYEYACSRHGMRPGCSNRVIFEWLISPEAAKQLKNDIDFNWAQNGEIIVFKSQDAVRSLHNKKIYILE